MAEVISSCSTLPGAYYSVPVGTTCDRHPDRLAVARVQGETDSMGAELNDMCEGCLAAYREDVRNENTSETCDWCKRPASRRAWRRDTDEGMYGPVYQVCRPCIDRENVLIDEELAEMDDRCGPLDDDYLDDRDDDTEFGEPFHSAFHAERMPHSQVAAHCVTYYTHIAHESRWRNGRFREPIAALDRMEKRYRTMCA